MYKISTSTFYGAFHILRREETDENNNISQMSVKHNADLRRHLLRSYRLKKTLRKNVINGARSAFFYMGS